MSDQSDLKSLLKLGEKTLAKVEMLEERAAEDRRQMTALREDLDKITRTMVEQQAKVEVFWSDNGRGAQWDERIRKNTKEVDDLSGKVQALEQEHATGKARRAGLMAGLGVGGGALSKLFFDLFG